MLLLLDDKLLFCVPVCATLQHWWLCVEEASRMRLLGNGNSASTEVCDGLDNVVLAVMASGLSMST